MSLRGLGPLNVRFVDRYGTAGVIHDGLTIESEKPISAEVRTYVKRVKHTSGGSPVSHTELFVEFLINLYVQTQSKK